MGVERSIPIDYGGVRVICTVRAYRMRRITSRVSLNAKIVKSKILCRIAFICMRIRTPFQVLAFAYANFKCALERASHVRTYALGSTTRLRSHVPNTLVRARDHQACV